MRMIIRWILGLLANVALCGCMGSVAMSTRDGTITARSSMFSYATLDSLGKEDVSIDLGGKLIKVSKKALTWKQDGCLELPASWNNLELVESGDAIVVNVDGNTIARIRPAT
jgi:hypothetical protein